MTWIRAVIRAWRPGLVGQGSKVRLSTSGHWMCMDFMNSLRLRLWVVINMFIPYEQVHEYYIVKSLWSIDQGSIEHDSHFCRDFEPCHRLWIIDYVSYNLYDWYNLICYFRVKIRLRLHHWESQLKQMQWSCINKTSHCSNFPSSDKNFG